MKMKCIQAKTSIKILTNRHCIHCMCFSGSFMHIAHLSEHYTVICRPTQIQLLYIAFLFFFMLQYIFILFYFFFFL